MKRKASLGNYSGSKSEWKEAYRSARIAMANNSLVDFKLTGLAWKATLIVRNERNAIDPLEIGSHNMLLVDRMIEEILADENA